MPHTIFVPNKRYTFSDYFNLPYPTEEIVLALGYVCLFDELKLPQTKTDKNSIERLKTTYRRLLPKITLNSEIAKREFMIAPVLYEVMLHSEAKLNIEYPIDVDDRLNGSLDYLIRAKQEIVVIEAKKGDMERGFNQLAAEMIALDKFEPLEQASVIYGALTIGEVWRFAVLQRESKQITKDINLYRYPQDIEVILATLVGILL